MARKHIPVTIVRPGVEEMVSYSFATVDQTDLASFIPFRYPFADISNLSDLQSAGFFRHGKKQPVGSSSASAEVSEELGGSDSANASTTLGYHLPRSEKLVLLVQVVTALSAETDKLTVTLSGSSKYLQDAVALEVTNPAAGSIFEIPLFNFGLYIGNEGEIKISQAVTTAADKDHIKYALVSREG
jgi:hypothetical protein